MLLLLMRESISLIDLEMFGKGRSDASSWRIWLAVKAWSFTIALCVRFIWFKYNGIVTLTYSMVRLSFHSTMPHPLALYRGIFDSKQYCRPKSGRGELQTKM